MNNCVVFLVCYYHYIRLGMFEPICNKMHSSNANPWSPLWQYIVYLSLYLRSNRWADCHICFFQITWIQVITVGVIVQVIMPLSSRSLWQSAKLTATYYLIIWLLFWLCGCYVLTCVRCREMSRDKIDTHALCRRQIIYGFADGRLWLRNHLGILILVFVL